MSAQRQAARPSRTLVARLELLGLKEHPGLLVRPNREGYFGYAFGDRAGPAVAIENVFHELGHAAEFGGDAFATRATAAGFVFRIPRQWVIDRFCCEPTTMQATAREIRAIGHQYHLQRMAGYRMTPPSFARHYAQVLNYMPDSCNVPGDDSEERQGYCANQILAQIDRVRPRDALERLVDWLDRTAVRLKTLRKRAREELFSREHAYRANGTPYIH